MDKNPKKVINVPWRPLTLSPWKKWKWNSNRMQLFVFDSVFALLFPVCLFFLRNYNIMKKKSFLWAPLMLGTVPVHWLSACLIRSAPVRSPTSDVFMTSCSLGFHQCATKYWSNVAFSHWASKMDRIHGSADGLCKCTEGRRRPMKGWMPCSLWTLTDPLCFAVSENR